MKLGPRVLSVPEANEE